MKLAHYELDSWVNPSRLLVGVLNDKQERYASEKTENMQLKEQNNLICPGRNSPKYFLKNSASKSSPKNDSLTLQPFKITKVLKWIGAE